MRPEEIYPKLDEIDDSFKEGYLGLSIENLYKFCKDVFGKKGEYFQRAEYLSNKFNRIKRKEQNGVISKGKLSRQEDDMAFQLIQLKSKIRGYIESLE